MLLEYRTQKSCGSCFKHMACDLADSDNSSGQKDSKTLRQVRVGVARCAHSAAACISLIRPEVCCCLYSLKKSKPNPLSFLTLRSASCLKVMVTLDLISTLLVMN